MKSSNSGNTKNFGVRGIVSCLFKMIPRQMGKFFSFRVNRHFEIAVNHEALERRCRYLVVFIKFLCLNLQLIIATISRETNWIRRNESQVHFSTCIKIPLQDKDLLMETAWNKGTRVGLIEVSPRISIHSTRRNSAQ